MLEFGVAWLAILADNCLGHQTHHLQAILLAYGTGFAWIGEAQGEEREVSGGAITFLLPGGIEPY